MVFSVSSDAPLPSVTLIAGIPFVANVDVPPSTVVVVVLVTDEDLDETVGEAVAAAPLWAPD